MEASNAITALKRRIISAELKVVAFHKLWVVQSQLSKAGLCHRRQRRAKTIGSSWT
jgi:hypothetical protein